ncbi:MAG: hypothetical protein ACP5UJ_08625 [Athalassotoga sp.]|uniref:DUF4351 domain-containing protein n=1 Tax=Caldisericum exile TaxID=693075 RepID=A0A2J6X8L7_9BACT|nr:MAG: hypothetical protein C0175_01595 [Caldisericum exile]
MEEEFIKDLKRRLKEMYDIDILKEEREELLAKCEKEKQAAIEEGIEKGKIEALRKDVSKLLLTKFKDVYTPQMKDTWLCQ